MGILESISNQKAATRRVLRARRDNLDAVLCASHSAAVLTHLFQLPELNAAEVIFCFISTGAEVSTHGVIDRLRALGRIVLVPKILPGEPMRAVPFTGWDNLTQGVLGIPAPLESVAYPSYVDLVITPGLGFTPTGTRIGFGRGYYDRWFATLEHGLRVGIAHECQLEKSLPTEISDVPMHIVITEQRTIHIKPRP